MPGLLIFALTVATVAPEASTRATFHASSAVATAGISVRIVEAGTVDFGSGHSAGPIKPHQAALIVEGQRIAATLVEFP